MNLIGQLGGYEKAKEILSRERNSENIDPVIYLNGNEILIDAICDTLLEYRRQHNIFEEIDKIVFIDDFMHGELMTVAWTRKGEVWMDEGAKRCTDLSMIRHATDAEIAAGRRLP